ncbi:unnamed protein product [Linum tenue]|uniref:Uncharacterized protein n=1 Tax=Linum tenue TaxID=586396 RepID=A0AAV0GXH8_9ROSI|nr:unnamed protein product [Linum tenue]
MGIKAVSFLLLAFVIFAFAESSKPLDAALHDNNSHMIATATATTRKLLLSPAGTQVRPTSYQECGTYGYCCLYDPVYNYCPKCCRRPPTEDTSSPEINGTTAAKKSDKQETAPSSATDKPTEPKN